MNNQEFIYWLGGFTSAVGKEGPSPKQWETIVSELNNIKEPISFPIGGKGWGTPNTTPIWQQPHYPNPWDEPGTKYKVTCEDYRSGIISGSIGTITTNGSTGTTAKPQFSTLTIGNTTTTLPKGATLNYTANLPEDL